MLIQGTGAAPRQGRGTVPIRGSAAMGERAPLTNPQPTYDPADL